MGTDNERESRGPVLSVGLDHDKDAAEKLVTFVFLSLV